MARKIVSAPVEPPQERTPTTSRAQGTLREVQWKDPLLDALGYLEVEIRGESPLILHRFSEKSQREIDETLQGTKARGRKSRDPERLFLDALHVIGPRPQSMADLPSTRYGFPALGFAKSMVNAVRQIKGSAKGRGGLSQPLVMSAVRVLPDDAATGLVEIHTPSPAVPVDDYARIPSTGSGTVTTRPYLMEWSARLRIEYNRLSLSWRQVLDLLRFAGRGVGIGDWRREKNGDKGMFGILSVKVSEEQDD